MNTCSCLNVGCLLSIVVLEHCFFLDFIYFIFSHDLELSHCWYFELYTFLYLLPKMTLFIASWVLLKVVLIRVLSARKSNCYVEHNLKKVQFFFFSDEKSGAAESKKSPESSTVEAPSGEGRTASAAAGAGVQNPFDFSAMSGLLNVHTRFYAE